jgi:hypothetical protein
MCSANSPSRRLALRSLAAAGALLALSGVASAHSPYGQWGVFRKSRLIVFAGADDAAGQALAQEIARTFAQALPESQATWARAPSAVDLVKLLGSHQADVALLPGAQLAAARDGSGRFAAAGATALLLIARVREHALVCLDEYPAVHTWRLARTLQPASAMLADDALVHPGARDYHAGRAIPAQEPQHRH